MNDEDVWVKIGLIVETYVTMARAELEQRWKEWPLDLSRQEVHEVVGALMARQVTLATQVAQAPQIWNGHIAPLILRTMTDTYISLAWILGDLVDRSRKFVMHGLGQDKLEMEHRKAELESSGQNPEDDPVVTAKQMWIDSQRFTFLTEVNLGSWSGINTRQMAEEGDCLSLYRYAYTPFSAATHSMWNHIGRYNLRRCRNPLHRYHGIPVDPDMPSDIDYLYRAAKYVAKTFDLFDNKIQIKDRPSSAFDYLCTQLEDIEKQSGQSSDKTAQEGESQG